MPHPAPSPLEFSRLLRDLLLAVLPALFHAVATHRVFTFRVFPTHDSPTAISGSVPSWSYETTTGLAFDPQRGENPASLDAFDSFEARAARMLPSPLLNESSCRRVTGCGGSLLAWIPKNPPAAFPVGHRLLVRPYSRAFGDVCASRVTRGLHCVGPRRSTRRLLSPTRPRRGQRIGAVYVVTSRSQVERRVNRLLLWRRGLAAFRALLHRCVRTMSRFPAASPILSWRFPSPGPILRPTVR